MILQPEPGGQYAADGADGGEHPLEASLDRLSRVAAEALGAAAARIVATGPDGERVVGRAGGARAEGSYELDGRVTDTAAALVVGPAGAAAGGPAAYAGVPLRGADAEVVGVLAVVDDEPRAWADHEIRILEGLAEMAARELDLRAAFRAERSRSEALGQSRRRYAQRLAEADQFRNLVERSLAGIYLVQDGRFLYCNPRLAEIFGYDREEILESKRVGDLVAEEDRGWVEARILRRLAGSDEDPHYAFRGVRRDGQHIEVEVYGNPTRVENRTAIVGTLLDVTDRNRAMRGLEDAVRARDEVLRVVSHDLRNPLNTIQLAAAMLLDSGEERRSDNLRRLEMIRRTAFQMNDMIQDLLDVSTLEAGQLVVDRSEHDLGAVLDGARDLLTPIAEDAGLEIVWETDASLPPCDIDAARMLRVFSNLVGNAIKFTPHGGRVRVGARCTGGEVEVSVRDSGPGIPADQLPRIFDRFWQGRPGDRRGSGLGLAISKGIVEAHGGRIRAESSEGTGTTFLFTIPVHRD